MRTLVVDPSIIIKGIFPEKAHEAHITQALQLLEAIKKDFFHIVQLPHWLIETMAVVTRLNFNIVQETVTLLNAMDFSIL